MNLEEAKDRLYDFVGEQRDSSDSLMRRDAEATETVLAELERLQAKERPGTMTEGERMVWAATVSSALLANKGWCSATKTAMYAVGTMRRLAVDAAQISDQTLLDPSMAMLREAVGR